MSRSHRKHLKYLRTGFRNIKATLPEAIDRELAELGYVPRMRARRRLTSWEDIRLSTYRGYVSWAQKAKSATQRNRLATLDQS